MSYISLEANISVGKSTLLPELARELGIPAIQEDLGANSSFLKALGEFNADPTMAINLQLTINEYREQVAISTLMDCHLVERSMLSDIVFTKVMNDRGEITNGDFRLFMAVAEPRLIRFPPAIVVQLACDPYTSFNRMQQRNRPEESNNTLEYITQLEDAHEDLLPNLCDEYEIPLIRIEYTNFKDPKDVAEAIDIIRRMIYVN